MRAAVKKALVVLWKHKAFNEATARTVSRNTDIGEGTVSFNAMKLLVADGLGVMLKGKVITRSVTHAVYLSDDGKALAETLCK